MDRFLDQITVEEQIFQKRNLKDRIKDHKANRIFVGY